MTRLPTQEFKTARQTIKSAHSNQSQDVPSQQAKSTPAEFKSTSVKSIVSIWLTAMPKNLLKGADEETNKKVRSKLMAHIESFLSRAAERTFKTLQRNETFGEQSEQLEMPLTCSVQPPAIKVKPYEALEFENLKESLQTYSQKLDMDFERGE